MSLQNFEQVDGRTQLNIGGNIIKQYYADEIFARPNLKPFVFITETGGGKTFTACDIIKACAEKGYNQINYITSTFNSAENKYARSQILEASAIQQNQVSSLVEIISEARTLQQQNFVDQLKITAKHVMSQLERDETDKFEQSVLNKMRSSKYTIDFLSKRVFAEDTKAVELLKYIITVSENPFRFKCNLEQNKSELEQIIGNQLNDKVQFEGEELTKQYIVNDWANQVYKISAKYDQDYIQICKEIIRNKIKQIIQGNSNMLLDHQMNGKSPNKDLERYLQLIMDPRTLCLVIDDVTPLLVQSGNKGTKIMCDGKEMTEKEAFLYTFNTILTQGRHYGTIMLGIHQTQNLTANLVSMISNVIVNPKTNLGSNRSLFIMAKDQKERVQHILSLLEKYNTLNKTYFNLICFNDNDQSPDPKSKFVLYQAQSQISGVFNLGIYKNSPFFYELGKLQMRRLYSTEADKLIQQVDENYKSPPINENKENESNDNNEGDDEYSDDEYSDDEYDNYSEDGSDD